MIEVKDRTDYLQLTPIEVELNRADLELTMSNGQWVINRKGVLLEAFDRQADAFDRYNQLKRRGKYSRGGN